MEVSLETNSMVIDVSGFLGSSAVSPPRGLAWVAVAENSGARPGGPRKGGKWVQIGISRWPVHPCEHPC